MGSALFLGIDIGTTNSKAVVISETGEVRGTAERAHGVDSPCPGRMEHDAEDVWWREVKELLSLLSKTSRVPLKDIAALAVSGIGATLVPTDLSGKALRPAILYGIDTRAWKETEEMEKVLGREGSIEIAGQPLSSQSMGPKYLWLKREEPEVYRNTDRLLGTNGYIVRKLTGEAVMDTGTAHFYGPLFDIEKYRWNEDICKRFNLDPGKLPRLLSPHEVAGHVTESASGETGIPAGTPVIAGTVDTYAEAVGAGAVRPGDIFLVYGSTMSLVVNTKVPVKDNQLWTNCHYVPETYSLIGAMATSGKLIQWFVESLLEKEEGAYDWEILNRFNNEAKSLPPGSEGLLVLPYFSGERTPLDDPKARGIIAGLTLGQGRIHIYRAILEGIAYGFMHHYEIIRNRGIAVNTIISAGGGVRNSLWTQIISDVSGCPQHCVITEVSSAPLGDAYMAGHGLGAFDLEKIIYFASKSKRRMVRPDRNAEKRYKSLYPLYRDLYEHSKGTVHALADAAEELRYRE